MVGPLDPQTARRTKGSVDCLGSERERYEQLKIRAQSSGVRAGACMSDTPLEMLGVLPHGPDFE